MRPSPHLKSNVFSGFTFFQILMIKLNLTHTITIFLLFFTYSLSGAANNNDNTINFEKSTYGLLFTTIAVNGIDVKAMIDFGDPNVLQLSSTFVKEQGLAIEKSGNIAKDLFGNTFEINKGIVKEVKIGDWSTANIEFSSSPNEMEAVSKQINTTFNAVIGWGYFSKYYIQMDYQADKFTLAENNIYKENVLFKTTFDKNSNYLNIPILINGNKTNLILDTGSPISMIDSSYYNQNNYSKIQSVIGETEVNLNLQIQNLEMLKQINAFGIIGGDFLNQYKVNIDPFQNEISFSQ